MAFQLAAIVLAPLAVMATGQSMLSQPIDRCIVPV
jgi:hypothetical protein